MEGNDDPAGWAGVIVQAARQKRAGFMSPRRLHVSVKGDNLSVNRGTKGSRVSVIEGVVRVAYGDRTVELTAGEEETSSASVAKVPIQNEVAWSRNSGKYLPFWETLPLCNISSRRFPASLRYSSISYPTFPITPWSMRRSPTWGARWAKQASFSRKGCSRAALQSWWKEQQGSRDQSLAT